MTRPRDDELDALLCDYIDGTLDDSARRRIEAILEGDPVLRRRVRAMADDAKSLKSLPREGVEYDLSEGFEVRAEREMLLGDVAGPTPASRRFRLPPAAVAAMLLLGVGLVWVSIEVASPDPITPQAAPLASVPESSPTAASDAATRSEPAELARRIAPATVSVFQEDSIAGGRTITVVAPLPASEWLAIARLRAGEATSRPVVAAVIESASPVASRMLVGSYFIDARVSAEVIPAPEAAAQTLQLLEQLGHPTQSGQLIARVGTLQHPRPPSAEPLGLLIRGIRSSEFDRLLNGLGVQTSPLRLDQQIASQSLIGQQQTLDPESPIDGVVIIREALP
jgi:hypothetical protein